jgi:hypothetical protein
VYFAVPISRPLGFAETQPPGGRHLYCQLLLKKAIAPDRGIVANIGNYMKKTAFLQLLCFSIDVL